MKLALLVAKVAAPTGQILAGLLTQSGAKMVNTQDAEGIVSYGVPYKGDKPCLNAKAGTFDNIKQLHELKNGGISVPPFVTDIARADWSRIEFPLLAREEKHHGGKDIKAVMQVEDIPWRAATGSKIFTQYIPIKEEYRFWVYRRRVQAGYIKQMKFPEKYKRIGRNYQNGFAFSFVEKDARPNGAQDIAAKAVFALGLDFGAVDLIHGKDGHFYVLEVNTAPGVSEGIRQGISTLAASIIKWGKGGFKKQNSKWSEA